MNFNHADDVDVVEVVIDNHQDANNLPYGDAAEEPNQLNALPNQAASSKSKSSKVLVGGAAALLVGATAFSATALKNSNNVVSNNFSSTATKAPKNSGKPKMSKSPGTKTPKFEKLTYPTIVGHFSTDNTTSCALAAQADISTDNYAACSRYWYGGAGQSSTCAGTAGYLTDPTGNIPSNGNPGDNTCLGMGDSPLCIDIEGFDEVVPVRVSAAWEWSEYDPPSTYNSNTCGYSTTSGSAPTPPSDGSSISLLPGNPCGRILTNATIPLVSPPSLGTGPDGTTGTTGQCYKIENNIVSGTVPSITTITSTVTITWKGTDYVCNIVEGGQLCEMWGFKNGYANNWDSQYIPFQCDDIDGDAYKGYIANVFDHNQLYILENGIGQAPQFSLTKL